MRQGAASIERLGGVILRTQHITAGGAALGEDAYGWPDLAALAVRLGAAPR
jgi:hypothetical protein